MRNSLKYVVSRAVSGALLDALKVSLLRAMAIQRAFSDDSLNEGKNEYATLKPIDWGRFLQSIVFDKIYLPGP